MNLVIINNMKISLWKKSSEYSVSIYLKHQKATSALLPKDGFLARLLTIRMITKDLRERFVPFNE